MGIITTNKKAYYDYEIREIYEAGIVLAGPEVKSVKCGKINLAGSYVTLDAAGTPWLINAHIAAYPPAAMVQQNYNPTQSRKLLLNKKEIIGLIGKTKVKGLTLIPLKVYTKKGFVKIEIGLARGKKKWDKREDIKKRDWERQKKQLDI